MRHLLYVLEGKTAVPVDTLDDWVRRMKWDHSRIVAHDVVSNAVISTVFLGVNYGWDERPPLIFETMIFGGPLDHDQHRWSTWNEAKTGHKRLLADMLAARDTMAALLRPPKKEEPDGE